MIKQTTKLCPTAPQRIHVSRMALRRSSLAEWTPSSMRTAERLDERRIASAHVVRGVSAALGHRDGLGQRASR